MHREWLQAAQSVTTTRTWDFCISISYLLERFQAEFNCLWWNLSLWLDRTLNTFELLNCYGAAWCSMVVFNIQADNERCFLIRVLWCTFFFYTYHTNLRERKGVFIITYTFVFLFSKLTGVWFFLCLPRKPRLVSWRVCWKRSNARSCERSRSPWRDCSSSISHWCTCWRTRYSVIYLLFLEAGMYWINFRKPLFLQPVLYPAICSDAILMK